ncbi:hypothetical protein V8E51_007752 [Hyaloscypha variabilis]
MHEAKAPPPLRGPLSFSAWYKDLRWSWHLLLLFPYFSSFAACPNTGEHWDKLHLQFKPPLGPFGGFSDRLFSSSLVLAGSQNPAIATSPTMDQSSSEFYVVPSTSRQPAFLSDDHLDFCSVPPAKPWNDPQPGILEIRGQTLEDPNTRIFNLDVPNNHIASLPDLQASLFTDYFNPQPGDVVWSFISQGLENQDHFASTSNILSTALNTGFDWNSSLQAADMLNSTTSSIGAQNLAPVGIEYPPTHSSDSMPSSVMSQSVSDSSSRKRERLVSSSSAEPNKQYKPLIPSGVHRCKWATCSETLDCISKLRFSNYMHVEWMPQNFGVHTRSKEASGFSYETVSLFYVSTSSGYSKRSLPAQALPWVYFWQLGLLLPLSLMPV